MLVNVALMVEEEGGDGGKISAFMSFKCCSEEWKCGSSVSCDDPFFLLKKHNRHKKDTFFYTVYRFVDV